MSAAATKAGPAPLPLKVGVAPKPRRVRTLITPEGVPLEVELAGMGDRMMALSIDGLVIFGVVLLIALSASWLPFNVIGPLVFLGIFFCTTLYFPWSELRWQGRTLGKKVAKIRVVDRAGGRLSTRAIVLRNLTREAETIVPLLVVLNPDPMFGGGPGWITTVSAAWVIVLAIVPLLQRDGQRIGDLIAGTIVIHAPREVLAPDLAAAAQRDQSHRGAATAEFTFTPAQLAFYGEYELEILAELLRAPRPDKTKVLAAVAEQVIAKIGWPRGARPPPSERFLLAFYAAQRARLESELLFGRRRASKRG